MKKLLSILRSGSRCFGSSGASRAQLAATNEAGVTMGHVHLVVQDVEAARSSGWRWGHPTKLARMKS